MRWWAEHALLPGGAARDVLLEESDGRFTAVTTGVPAADVSDAVRLPGVVLPGFANAHSHAFHRALRGRSHGGGGSFWTWREQMYAVSARLTPDSMLALARATYAEMALAGITTVGEFHYLHHAPDGRSYDDPNAMGEALRQAAAEAGIRLTLLDTCYLAGGLTSGGHLPLDEHQRRFADADVDAWGARAAAMPESDGLRRGVAIHSVRAVPASQLPTVLEAGAGRPVHIHVSEQPAENEACASFYGRTPTGLLHDAGALGPATTAVHATHLTDPDIGLLADAGSSVCFCPTTERDLADGIGPARRLADAGVTLSLGSDQHAVTDLLEEARGMESDERLASMQRGRFTPAELLDALSRHDGLGWDSGRLQVGTRADLVAVRLDTVRTAGVLPDQVVMAAGAADVHTVVVDGRTVVEDGQHRIGDVGRALFDAIAPLWPDG